MNLLAYIGQPLVQTAATSGRFFFFTLTTASHLVRPPFFPRLIAVQIMRIGYNSLAVVALTLFFTGAVLALQVYRGNTDFNSEAVIATIVALGITRELGPVLAGLMVAGRISAAIAAELGSMRVTEQIDALSTLATDPYKYLIVPRVVAAFLCLPVLVLVADTIGIMGGFIVSVQGLGFSPNVYLRETYEFLTFDAIFSGMVKASVFGVIIALFGSFYGFYSEGGAQGVGQATTKAVASSMVMILIANYVMTSLFFD